MSEYEDPVILVSRCIFGEPVSAEIVEFGESTSVGDSFDVASYRIEVAERDDAEATIERLEREEAEREERREKRLEGADHDPRDGGGGAGSGFVKIETPIDGTITGAGAVQGGGEWPPEDKNE